jgi:xylan 1,4-beta-xylosidase
MIQNPVLPGFNPDSSFLRVGEDYYIATSTFEWYSGVQIFMSRDLVKWTLVARPLNTAALLDMRGNPGSCGVWAPCLSHDGAFKDAHNYITACETIDGNWCDPWHVNSLGFDASLFHDADGRKWFLNLRWNHRGPGTGGTRSMPVLMASGCKNGRQQTGWSGHWNRFGMAPIAGLPRLRIFSNGMVITT